MATDLQRAKTGAACAVPFMKQIIQSFKTGETILEEVPAPSVGKGCVLIRSSRSLVSLGTERMLVEFGRAGLIQKARQQPDRVRQVLDKIRAEGLMPTLEAVFSKLEQPIPLGYCNAGTVIAVGEGVTEFRVGNRVASNGHHAEFVCVPQNLVAAIPDNVSDEEASFAVIGAIGLQGIRLCQPTLGETIVVAGLGLVGLITAELLLASGCRVIGIDPDPAKLELARRKGITALPPGSGKEIVRQVQELTQGVGADGVIITASSQGDELIAQAAQMSRKRGRIILVGVVGLNISRADFYEKELSFQVSCSYGPGRYDDAYEEQGIDYPLPYVRWTEKRNFQAVLDAISSGRLDVQSLITQRVALADYRQVYDHIGRQDVIAAVLEYPENSSPEPVVHLSASLPAAPGQGGMALIGAGNYTRMTLLPALKEAGARVLSIASAGGVTGTLLAKKYNIPQSTTDYTALLRDPSVDMVLIATRHHQHARMVVESLQAGKHVFVEKPLAIREDELQQVIDAYDGTRLLTVGFNRRFSPHAQKMKQLLGNAPANFMATMNAGFIAPDSWVHDLQTGGGRIIGEACHLVDLLSFLAGSKVTAVCMNAMGTQPRADTDNASILLRYENGSTGTIHYFSNGSRAYSKERVEVYSLDRTLVMDNFMVTKGYGFKGFSKLKTAQDKGHKALFRQLTTTLTQGGGPLIPFEELVNTTRACLAAIESLRQQSWIAVR